MNLARRKIRPLRVPGQLVVIESVTEYKTHMPVYRVVVAMKY
jgi:hypothetical protein